MAAVSKPILYGGILVIAVAAYWSFGSQPESLAKKPHQAKTKKKSAAQSDYVAADFTSKFDKPQAKLRNLFQPLVKSESVRGPESMVDTTADIIKIPSAFADGDPNWEYTGFAIVNETRMALLENPTIHQAGYVREGETWKKSKVRRITGESIALVDTDGVEQVVLRFNTNTLKNPMKVAEAPIQPVNPTPAMTGPIGGPQIQIVPNPRMPRGVTFRQVINQ